MGKTVTTSPGQLTHGHTMPIGLARVIGKTHRHGSLDTEIIRCKVIGYLGSLSILILR